MVAALIERDAAGRVGAARVAVGSCSAVAQRLPELEAELVGAPAAPGIGDAVGPSISRRCRRSTTCARPPPIAGRRLTLVRRALEACVAEA